MFEKLLSLLLQAKGGAVATVFVLGTTGALVTATVDAGVTTITITQPSEATTGSETTTPDGTRTNTTVTDAILALFNRTSAEDDPTATATGKGCSDEAHARNDAMKDVNDGAKVARDEVRSLSKGERSGDARELVKDADTEVRDIRQLAVKAIHATFDCDPNEDADAEGDAAADNTSDIETSLSFSGDAEAIATLALELMEQVVADLKEALEGLEDSEESETTSDEKQNGKSNDAKNDNKGKSKDKGNGKGRD